MTLLANVLQSILHKVLLITKVKISRCCSTINFIQDYFRQQSLYIREIIPGIFIQTFYVHHHS